MDLEEGDEIRDSRDRKRIRKTENRRHRKIVRENDRTRARRGDFREIRRATEIERQKRN